MVFLGLKLQENRKKTGRKPKENRRKPKKTRRNFSFLILDSKVGSVVTKVSFGLFGVIFS